MALCSWLAVFDQGKGLLTTFAHCTLFSKIKIKTALLCDKFTGVNQGLGKANTSVMKQTLKTDVCTSLVMGLVLQV